MTNDASDIQDLRQEIDKLSRVVTAVMGQEFDAILARQSEDQRATLRWVAQSMAVSVALMQLLVEQRLLDEEACVARVRELRDRFLATAERVGAQPDITDIFTPPQ